MTRPLRIGHRGACGHAPENTLASIRKALELEVHGIEFDIQLSKDGEPMVIHDDTIDRSTNGKGLVSDYTYHELQQFDAGNGERIPHLNDVFAMVAAECELYIELKADCGAAVEKCVRHWVEKGWEYDQISILSFNHLQLVDIRRLNPKLRTCASFYAVPVKLAAMGDDAGAYAIAPGVEILEQALVDDAHARGLKIFTWTANDAQAIDRAHRLGVDGIMSDYPEKIL